MQAKLEYLLLEFDQPNEIVWADMKLFAEEWNLSHENKFLMDESTELAIYFHSEKDKEIDLLETIFREKERSENWVWIKTIPYDPTVEEIESHDFIQIIGDGYADAFSLNGTTAFDWDMTCNTCGTEHPHLITQKQSLQIDESFLSQLSAPNTKHEPPGLDMINIAGGGLLISNRIAKLLNSETNAEGYSLIQVMNEKGEVSDKVFQLRASNVILIPSNMKDEGDVCPACGTVLTTQLASFDIKKDWVKNDKIFSRASSGFSSFYVKRELFEVLKSEKARGLTVVHGVNVVS